MTAVPTKRLPHTEALLARLGLTGLPVGSGIAPDTGGWTGAKQSSLFVAYLVLHSIPGGTVDGSIAEPDADADWLWQVTATGASPEQAELAADMARTALLATPLTVAGRSVMRLTIETPGGARRDDTVLDPIWISTEIYRLNTTP